MWAILAAGSHLQPPHALAGAWVPVEADKPGIPPFTISQSGRFLKLRFGAAEPLILNWESETTDESGARTIRLQGEGQSVEVYVAPAAPSADPPAYRFMFRGAWNGVWLAVRTNNRPQSHSSEPLPSA